MSDPPQPALEPGFDASFPCLLLHPGPELCPQPVPGRQGLGVGVLQGQPLTFICCLLSPPRNSGTGLTGSQLPASTS